MNKLNNLHIFLTLICFLFLGLCVYQQEKIQGISKTLLEKEVENVNLKDKNTYLKELNKLLNEECSNS